MLCFVSKERTVVHHARASFQTESRVGSCHVCRYQTHFRPTYKIAYKTVTQLEWRCCPGHQGYDCRELKDFKQFEAEPFQHLPSPSAHNPASKGAKDAIFFLKKEHMETVNTFLFCFLHFVFCCSSRTADREPQEQSAGKRGPVYRSARSQATGRSRCTSEHPTPGRGGAATVPDGPGHAGEDDGHVFKPEAGLPRGRQ